MSTLSSSALELVSLIALWLGVAAAIVAALSGVVAALANGEKEHRSDLRVSENERIAAEAKLETERLKLVVAWRVLPEGGAGAITAVASRYPGQHYTLGVAEGPESRRLMERVDGILRMAGWVRDPLGPDVGTQTADGLAGIYDFAGLAVAYSPLAPTNTKAGATELAETFTTLGLPMRAEEHPQFNAAPGRVLVMVGYKPIND